MDELKKGDLVVTFVSDQHDGATVSSLSPDEVAALEMAPVPPRATGPWRKPFATDGRQVAIARFVAVGVRINPLRSGGVRPSLSSHTGGT